MGCELIVLLLLLLLLFLSGCSIQFFTVLFVGVKEFASLYSFSSFIFSSSVVNKNQEFFLQRDIVLIFFSFYLWFISYYSMKMFDL